MFYKLRDPFLASPDAFMIDPITLTDVLRPHQSKRAEQVPFIINHRMKLPYAVAWRNLVDSGLAAMGNDTVKTVVVSSDDLNTNQPNVAIERLDICADIV